MHSSASRAWGGTLIVLAWSLLAAAPARAQFAQPDVRPAGDVPRLAAKAELSLVSATGNSDSQTLGAGAEFEFHPDTWDVLFRANGVHSSSQDTVRAESLAGLSRVSHRVVDGLEAFGQVTFLRNRFSGIASRVATEGGFTYRLLPGLERHELRLLAGLGYLRERHVATATDRFATAGTGARYRWRISEHSELADELNVIWSLDDAGDWRTAQRASLTAAISEGLSLKLSQQIDFKRQPEPGFRRTDTLTSVAFVVTF